MSFKIPDYKHLKTEIEFSTARSSGPGGQHVNKTSSKVILRWNLPQSALIDEQAKDILGFKLKTKLTKDGDLIITEQGSRSQLVNKQECISKFDTLLKKSFQKRKIRKPTKPTKSSKQKREKQKNIRSEKKKWRQKPDH